MLKLSSWRPITLLNTVYKLFMKVLSQRIMAWTQHSGWLSWSQKGFQPGLDGCREQVFSISQFIEIANREKERLRILFVDLRNAFGTITHGLIELGLELGLGECRTTSLIMATYKKASDGIVIYPRNLPLVDFEPTMPCAPPLRLLSECAFPTG
jgi:hypothetical protein